MMKTRLFLNIVLAVCTALFVLPVQAEEERAPKDKIVMPQYPGGEEALKKYLLKELQYPYEAQKIEAKGEVVVSFFVERSGSITGVHVIKSVATELDAEAMRVIRNMPRWVPGSKNGVPMRAQMSIPINFKFVKNSDKYVDGETMENGLENKAEQNDSEQKNGAEQKKDDAK